MFPFVALGAFAGLNSDLSMQSWAEDVAGGEEVCDRNLILSWLFAGPEEQLERESWWVLARLLARASLLSTTGLEFCSLIQKLAAWFTRRLQMPGHGANDLGLYCGYTQGRIRSKATQRLEQDGTRIDSTKTSESNHNHQYLSYRQSGCRRYYGCALWSDLGPGQRPNNSAVPRNPNPSIMLRSSLDHSSF